VINYPDLSRGCQPEPLSEETATAALASRIHDDFDLVFRRSKSRLTGFPRRRVLPSTQASQTLFIAAKSAMSAN
jgi:hypothetical protein